MAVKPNAKIAPNTKMKPIDAEELVFDPVFTYPAAVPAAIANDTIKPAVAHKSIFRRPNTSCRRAPAVAKIYPSTAYPMLRMSFVSVDVIPTFDANCGR